MSTRISPRIGCRSLASVLLAAAIVVVTLPAVALSPAAVSEGFIVHDDETVYVVADASGSPRDVVVVDWLRVEGEGTLTLVDPGEVSAAEALEDDIEPALTDTGVEWELDVDGRRDFFYRADTERELPVAVEAIYYLDGTRVEPDLLAGATGRVRIEVTVTNNLQVTEEATYTGADGLSRTEEVEYWVPMLAPVKIDIDGRRFLNIEADPEIVSVTGSTISHTFMTFPQPSETISIEMDGTDIEIDPIIVSVFPKMAGSPDLSIADDLADLKEGLDGLTLLSEGHHQVLSATAEGIDTAQLEGLANVDEGFGQLVAGTEELESGTAGLVTLLDGQIAYLDGIICGLQGQDLSQIAQLPTALAAISDSVAGIRDGIDGLVTLLGGQITYLDAISASSASLESRAWALASASPDETTTALAEGLSAQRLMLGALRDGDSALGLPYGLTDTRDNLQEISTGLTGIAGALGDLAVASQPLEGLPAQFDAIEAALRTLRNGGLVQGRQLPGLVTNRAGLSGVVTGIGQVGTGIGTAAEALAPLEELPGMLGELRSVLLAVSDGGTVRGNRLPGVSTTIEGLEAMSAGLSEGIDELTMGQEVVDRMELAAEGYDTFLGKPEGATGEVRFIIKLDGIEQAE
jgi:hypothetical protein